MSNGAKKKWRTLKRSRQTSSSCNINNSRNDDLVDQATILNVLDGETKQIGKLNALDASVSAV